MTRASTASSADAPEPVWIDEAAARRLCIAVIAGVQDRMIREGRLGPETHVQAALGRTGSSLDAIRIDETDLGFDSLARLDLVAETTEFFGLAATGVEDYLLVQRTLGDWSRLVAWHFGRIGADAEIGFATSGTTGAPKRVPRTRPDLDEEVGAIVAEILPAAPSRIVSLVSPRHLYGFLWSVLLPRALDVEVLALDAAMPTAVGREARAGDLIVATPFQWERCAACGPLPQSVTGVSSGGPSTLDTWTAATALGLSAFLEVYGSTESGGVGVRCAPDAPFRLFPHLVRSDDHICSRAARRKLTVPDRVEWVDGDRFRLLGRRDGVVQVAGTNVDPAAVAETIAALPEVREATVRLGGARLKAFVVPEAGCDPVELETTIRAALCALPAPARPDRIAFGTMLPRDAVGKLCDW